MKSYLSDMQLIRNKTDYTEEQISRKVAYRWLSKAEELVGLTGKEAGK